jgi:hypothetical protein
MGDKILVAPNVSKSNKAEKGVFRLIVKFNGSIVSFASKLLKIKVPFARKKREEGKASQEVLLT